jgi:hypothetical protein
VIVLLGVELLLVGFSICAAVLDQSALAVMAGTASITLAGEIARRFLTSPTPPGGTPDGQSGTDGEPTGPTPPPESTG